MKELIRHEGQLLDWFEEVEVPDPDTSLHIMGGPPTETPQWVIDSWQRAAEKRLAQESTEAPEGPSE